MASPGVSVINVAIGFWLVLSPFVVTAFNPLLNLKVNNAILGILVFLMALIRSSNPERAEWSWVNVALGIWLIISPFALGLSSIPTAVWHNVITGILVVLVASSRSFTTLHSVAHAT
jgi:hypothetical protein